MTKGHWGALAFGGELFYDPLEFPVDMVDTTGMGDVFRSGFIYGVFQEFELSRTLRFANVLVALNYRELGGRAGLYGLDDVENFIAKFPNLRVK